MPFPIPTNIDIPIAAHRKWMDILTEAKKLIEKDAELQYKASKGYRIPERALPPEVLGTTYAQYCTLINRMYEIYLTSVHLQRAPYIKDIVSVFMRRMYELRNEIVHLIINDYIYADAALMQLHLTPKDIEIVVPYHFAVEARKDSVEELLQTMWAEAVARKNAPPPKEEASIEDDFRMAAMSSEVVVQKQESEPSIKSDEFLQVIMIQRQERFRQYYMDDFRAKNIERRLYAVEKVKTTSKFMKSRAASVIQSVYRKFMEIQRQHMRENKLKVKLGLMPDPWRPRLDLDEENRKFYDMRRRTNERARAAYMQELEKENTRLIIMKKDDQIEDISEHIRVWFKEWYRGYGFFPEYPYEVEGGTIMVIRGDFPTIEEKIEADQLEANTTKGKTKDMIKKEKQQAKLEAKVKAEAEKEAKKKEAETEFKMKCNPFNDLGYRVQKSEHMDSLAEIKKEKQQAKLEAKVKAEAEKEAKKKEAETEFKMKCNPFNDLGYRVQKSEHMDSLAEALQGYSASWSIYDKFPPNESGEVIYGFIKSMLTEELMCQMHKDCRIVVDELMRLELKLLITAHQAMYKLIGMKYPKIKPRKKPKMPSVSKPLIMNETMMHNLEEVFDLEIITKPMRKIKDIIGDSNYAAYDLNIQDPNAKFPPPGFGDVRRRLTLSCVFASGFEPKAVRNKAVLLLGPVRHGKSFMVDCVAGELNAVKIDISPEVFSAVLKKPQKTITQVFVAARVFQPCVIYLRNIERVFQTKVPPEEKHLNAKAVKAALVKCVKSVSADDKIIFIATCSNPFGFPAGPMVSIFDETILVPRTDCNSLQLFFYHNLQSIRSMERDYSVQPIAQLLQGYGFGAVIETYHKVLTPERIAKLNYKPLWPGEFLELLMANDIEPVTMEDYEEYVNFFIQYSPLKKEREDFAIINRYREVAYTKMAKKKADDEKKK